MITLRNIVKSYGDKAVYDNFNFDIDSGKILCILGPSGSGKTTLLNILAGLTDYKGNISNVPKNISYIFQEDRLIQNLTVKENILYATGGDNGTIDHVLDKLEILDSKDLYPKDLSGGMARRVSLARAFCYDSKLLLMDEPFSSLDTGLKMRLIGLFKDLWKDDKRTTVFVTHNIDEAVMVADRIVVVDGGRITYDITLPDEARDYNSYPDIKSQILEKLM